MSEKKKVLIVDDDPDAIFIVKNHLNPIDAIETITADDGETGLEKARDEQPDLIILDVQMPGMSGFDVFAELVKDDRTKNIPVVMLTSVAEQTGLKFSAKEMKNFIGEEPADYVEKPGEPEEIRRKVSKLLGL